MASHPNFDIPTTFTYLRTTMLTHRAQCYRKFLRQDFRMSQPASTAINTTLDKSNISQDQQEKLERFSIAQQVMAPLVLHPEQLLKQGEHCFTYSFKTIAARTFSRLPFYQSLTLLENDNPLPMSHAHHDEIRSVGHGRYSLWQDCVYFSSTDGSDPRSNGRQYSLLVPAYVRFLEGMRLEAIQMYGL